MIPLPVCRHRKEQNDRGWHRCESPRIIGKYVPEDICQYCRCPDHELRPATTLEKIVNVAVAAAGHLLAGSPLAAPEERDRRLAICDGCEHYSAGAGTCKLCGCGTVKATWADQACPLKKW